MKWLWRPAVLLASLMLTAAQCTTSSSTADNSPASSPSTATSPSSSSSPSSAASPSSSPSSSPAGTPLAITSLPFHNGEVGILYLAVQLGAAGGTAPYQWSVSGGTFPPGQTLSGGGVVSGTNTQAGQFKFTIKVADAAGASATSPAGYGVFSQLVTTQPCATQCVVEEGCTICGNFGSVSGGLAPYHYKITSDDRPPGMGLNGLNLTGAFPVPGPIGGFSMTVQVLDAFGAQRTVVANWAVFAHIALTQTSFVCGFSASSCTIQVSYTGGTPGGSPTVKVIGIGDAFFSGNDQGPPRITSGANCQTSAVPTGLPPGTTVSSGSGVATLNIPSPTRRHTASTPPG